MFPAGPPEVKIPFINCLVNLVEFSFSRIVKNGLDMFEVPEDRRQKLFN